MPEEPEETAEPARPDITHAATDPGPGRRERTAALQHRIRRLQGEVQRTSRQLAALERRNPDPQWRDVQVRRQIDAWTLTLRERERELRDNQALLARLVGDLDQGPTDHQDGAAP